MFYKINNMLYKKNESLVHPRSDNMGVSKINYDGNKFSFSILYEGINGDALYFAHGIINNGEYIIMQPQKNMDLTNYWSQIKSTCETESIYYDEVNILLERALVYTNGKYDKQKYYEV